MNTTVREAVKLLKSATRIEITHGEYRVCELEKQNVASIALEAWGDFLVEEIVAIDSDNYEIILATRPIKRSVEV